MKKLQYVGNGNLGNIYGKTEFIEKIKGKREFLQKTKANRKFNTLVTIPSVKLCDTANITLLYRSYTRILFSWFVKLIRNGQSRAYSAVPVSP